jgi:predicted Zn finger-like uncharacterized protein
MMVLVCSACKNQITLEDASVPEGIFKVRCTGCGKIITAQRNAPSAQPPAPLPATTSGSFAPVVERNQQVSDSQANVSPAVEAFIKKEITAAKKEILKAMQSLFTGTGMIKMQENESGISQKALVCSGDPLVSQSLSQAAQSMGYATEATVTTADSMKSLDTNYSLILIDPSFSDDLEAGKKLIGRINARKAVDRRNIFVVLISSTHKTLDGNAAFMNGVNLIVNKADLNALVPSIKQSQRDFQQMYAAYHAAGGERRL